MQFLYLILSLYYGRRNPLFYLIFPIALIQGPGAFIDTRTVLFLPEYFLLQKNISKDIIIVYLILVVILVVIFNNHKIDFKLLTKGPMKWYFYWIFLLSIYTILAYGTSYEAISVIRLFLYMPLGYFLLLLIFSASNWLQFKAIFNILAISNIIISVLYVLNSSKALAIFDTSLQYLNVDGYKTEFLRDFLTIPLFSNLLFIYAFTSLLIRKSILNKKLIYLTAITYPFVLLYTFTRSLIGMTLIEMGIVLIILILFKSKQVLSSKFIIITLTSIMFFFIIKSVLSNEFKYFESRIESASDYGKDDENVEVRLLYHQEAYKILTEDANIFMGVGFNKRYEKQMSNVGAWAADSTIPFILLYTGLIGTLLFFYFHWYYMKLLMKNYFLNFNSLAISLFALLTTSAILALFMGGYSWGNPIVFINFVFSIYLININKNAKNIGNNIAL